MNSYISVKKIKSDGQIVNVDGKDCVKVIYPDGYESYCPADDFKRHYFRLEKDNKISQSDVDRFAGFFEYHELDERTVVGMATAVNKFKVIEASACVKPETYDLKIGMDICRDRIKNKFWAFLGFLLACADYGMECDE